MIIFFRLNWYGKKYSTVISAAVFPVVVFPGILLRASAFPPSLNFHCSVSPGYVTFYIKCYMIQKALATKGFFGGKERRRAVANQIPESKKRCETSKKQPM
jgi:hypothetical protein